MIYECDIMPKLPFGYGKRPHQIGGVALYTHDKISWNV